MLSTMPILKPASVLGALALAAAAFVPQSQAAPSFDGTWTVTIAVENGACKGRTVPIQVADGHVRYAGTFRAEATGRVSPQGALNVSFSRRGDVAHATGALDGTAGRGNWTSPTKDCSGTWSARKA